jgi:metallophosphoesterase (TIGR00282 family)
MEEYECSFCIANGENMAGGGGMTRRCINSLLEVGVDVITGGDHMWDERSLQDEITQMDRVLRPANVSPRQPGRGFGVFESRDGVRIGVVLLLGRTFMHTPADCPFRTADLALAEIGDRADLVFVDMHAEATSEKIAMGRYLDGRVTAVLGTHTHVPTADAVVFPGGTAFQCDLGMVGSRDSVLGRSIDSIVTRFVTGMPTRFKVVETAIRLHGAVVCCDPGTGHARSVTSVYRDYEETASE